MKKSFIVSTLIALTLISCKKEKAENQPVACGSVSKELIATGEIVLLSNCSQSAFYYEWDFGDGTNSTVKNPTHAYSKPGNYTIKLTAYSPSKTKVDDETFKVSVIDKYLTRIIIKKIPFRDSNDNTWDANDGPDIHITFNRRDDILGGYKSDTISNVTDSDLPIMRDNLYIKVTDDQWYLGIIDVDPNGGSDVMAYWAIKPTETDMIHKFVSFGGRDVWDVELYFTLL